MTYYDELLAEAGAEQQRLVSVQRGSDRATVTLDDAAKLNVLSAPLVLQLKAALVELVADTEIRSIVLTGADPGFSAGGDLRMMRETPRALESPAGATASGAGSGASSAASPG